MSARPTSADEARAENGALDPRPTPLGRTHADARRLAGPRAAEPPLREDLLFGTRARKKPLIALTRQDLGPCRHALSQMVVAGTMTVHPPINAAAAATAPTRVGEKPREPAKAEPRVLTFTPPPLSDEALEALPKRHAPPPAAPPRPPARPARPPAPRRDERAVERTILEDFNPSSRKDE